MSRLPVEVALDHQVARARLASSATVKAVRLWRQMNPQELDAGWQVVAPRMVGVVTAAQVKAATSSTTYLDAVDRYYGQTSTSQIVPEAFGGVTLDGRELGPAMFGAVTTTKELTGSLGATRAFEVGASFLATVVGAAVQDMGRQADNTLAVGRTYTRYVRVVNPGACSRCAVLAGKASYRTAFKRHPRCRCTAFPLPPAGSQRSPEGFFDEPGAYFDSLSKAEQDRVFTKAGAEAIRNGADPIKVVNARRGAYGIGYNGHYNLPVSGNRLKPVMIGVRADGTPLQVYATTEGTTIRGQFFKSERDRVAGVVKDGRYTRTTTIRLLPEQIAVMAGGDPVRWRELLIRYGYIA